MPAPVPATALTADRAKLLRGCASSAGAAAEKWCFSLEGASAESAGAADIDTTIVRLATQGTARQVSSYTWRIEHARRGGVSTPSGGVPQLPACRTRSGERSILDMLARHVCSVGAKRSWIPQTRRIGHLKISLLLRQQKKKSLRRGLSFPSQPAACAEQKWKKAAAPPPPQNPASDSVSLRPDRRSSALSKLSQRVAARGMGAGMGGGGHANNRKS